MAQIRSTVDEKGLANFKRQFKGDERSIEEEAVRLLRQVLGSGRDAESLVARARAISSLTPRGVRQTDSVTLVRQDRDH